MKQLKQISMYIVVGLCLLAPKVYAQEIITDGIGSDTESALRDASRNAVEQVVGTLIDSRTIVENATVTLDSIYTKSQGFVTSQQILSQDKQQGLVHVRAKINVNTNPNSQLMNNLNMIMSLNDPRIAVIILKQDARGTVMGHDYIAEAALNDRLLELGFSHIIDAGVVSSLENAQLLSQIYNGRTNVSAVGQSFGADYVVLGRMRTQFQDISLPDGKGGYTPTLLKTGNAELTVKVIKFDTGDIVGTFTTTAKGVENNNEMAEQKAVQNASQEAAKKLEEKFRHFSAISQSAIQLEVYTTDNNAVNQLIQDLKALSIVENVYLREQQQGKVIISIDTTETANGLIQMLRRQTQLGLFVASVTAHSAKISISQ